MAFNIFMIFLVAVCCFVFQGRRFQVDALAQLNNGQGGYVQGSHIPILYEAYYPEQQQQQQQQPRQWNPLASLREIKRLRELTSQLLREEEQLGQMAAAAAATAESVERPLPVVVESQGGQVLRYVFSGDEAQQQPQRQPIPLPARAVNGDDDVQVASLTISDVGPHKTRHHHGQANWLLRRLAA